MPKLQTLASLTSSALLTLTGSGEIVLWKALGTVSTKTGVFSDAGIEDAAPVEIRVTYDDDAEADQFGGIPAFGTVDLNYRTNIFLNITVSIDQQEWQGSVTTGTPTTPRTFTTRVRPPDTLENVSMLVSSADNGTFQSFPLQRDAGPNLIDLDFVSLSGNLLTSGISASSLDASQISAASGFIESSSGNRITFSIDPASVEILNESDEVVSPIKASVSASVANDAILITWFTDSRFRYRLEGTNDLSSQSWTAVETRNGVGAVRERTYPLAEAFQFYRVVTLPLPDAAP